MSDCSLCDAGIPAKTIKHIPVEFPNGTVGVLMAGEKLVEKIVESFEEDKLIKQAQEELYNAIQALEDRDLPFARSSSARATGLIVEAHQRNRKVALPVDPNSKPVK